MLRGLTRGSIRSSPRHRLRGGTSASSRGRTRSASCLPSNSPGVHSLWLPAIALKTPLVLKPGSAEPWTPYRIIQALIKAGAPPEAFGYYPSDHARRRRDPAQHGRGMVFGDVSTTKRLGRAIPRRESTVPATARSSSARTQADEWEQVHRRDRRVDCRQLRPLVRQCVRGVDAAARRRNRRGARGEAGAHRARSRQTIRALSSRRLPIRTWRGASRR